MKAETTEVGLSRPDHVFVLSGPSGVGKNAIAARLCRSGRAVRAVTATSRPPRPGEGDGVDYYFVSDDEFESWIKQGRLLEHTRYCGHFYGTPAFSVDRALETGKPVLLVIDVDGALQLKNRWPGIRLIFIAPPSAEALMERLQRRADESEENVRRRLERARQEMSLSSRYDWVIVNARLDEAVEQVAQIISGAPAAPGSEKGR